MDQIELRGFQASDADWVVARHADLYAVEEGYDDSYRALVAEIVAGFLARPDPARAQGWIAVRGGERLGSIFVVQDEAGPDVAKLRLVLVEPAARGTGLAQRMLDRAMDFARSAGYRQMRLWTHESHRAAGRLYARNGFDLVQSTPAMAFGVAVVDQIWQRALKVARRFARSAR